MVWMHLCHSFLRRFRSWERKAQKNKKNIAWLPVIRREKLPSKSVEEKEVNIWLKIENMTSFQIIVCFNPLSPKSD